MKNLLILLLVFTGCLEVMSEGKSEKVVVAHRGGAFLGPENTLACVEKGMEAGAEWIEIDVHLSKDGKVVVCHDDRVDRTTDGKGYISEMTYDQIRALKVVDAEGNVTDEYVPLLHEVLEQIKGRANLLLEIKRSRHSLPGIEQACIDCVESYGMTENVVFQSFDDEVIETVHALRPEIRVEKLLYVGLPFFFDFDKYEYAASFNVCHSFVSGAFIRHAHERGKEVKVWTLNKYKKSLVDTVDGIITNDPALFIGK